VFFRCLKLWFAGFLLGKKYVWFIGVNMKRKKKKYIYINRLSNEKLTNLYNEKSYQFIQISSDLIKIIGELNRRKIDHQNAFISKN